MNRDDLTEQEKVVFDRLLTKMEKRMREKGYALGGENSGKFQPLVQALLHHQA